MLKLIFSYFAIFLFLNAATVATFHIDKKNLFTKEEKPIFEEISKNQVLKEKKLLLKKELRSLLKLKNPSTLSKSLTKKYYRDNNYETFFVTPNKIKPIATQLLDIIKNDEVLKPNINNLFNFKTIEKQISATKNSNFKAREVVKLDFLFISLYHTYMRYLKNGIIDWNKFQDELKELDEKKEIIANWSRYIARKNIRTLLYKAIEQDDMNIAINEVNYTFPKAKELSKLIEKYESILNDGGYLKLPMIKKSLKRGNFYPEIKLLRKRLLQSGDLSNSECIDAPQIIDTIKPKDCKEFFDNNVLDAVLNFQKRHGLAPDGIVGKKTILSLNMPIEKRIETMRINLERMRWLPRNLGEKYVIVNIPDFNLKMYKDNHKILDMAVVVGEKNHPTPIFSNKISTVVLNPYWRIPQSIVKNEIIPKLVEDSTYLVKNDIKAFENWSHKSMEYDVSSVDWSIYLDNNLVGDSQSAPMRFIQIPGEKNPLGRMKFLFPNRYSVYLHDTPAKELFKNYKRAFSHGCIRIAKPHELLKVIAQEDNSFEYEKAEETLIDIEKTDLYLKNKIPVHIVYLTSWIDENGVIQFRDDIYNYDKIQKRYIYKTN